MQVWSVEGNRQMLDGGAMFGNAPKALWQRWLTPDEKNRIELACRCLLLKSGEQYILFEAGIGNFFSPKLAERFGVQSPDKHLLLSNLDKLSVAPEQITAMIPSHLHFDHVGGLLPSHTELQKTGPKLVFEAADYYISEGAWERSQDPHPRDRASFIPELNEALQNHPRLKIVEKGQNPVSDIEFLYSDGHTPGHMHSLIHGENKKIFFCGDLIPGAAWLNPAITMGYDRFPEGLIDEKKQILKRAAAEGWILFFTHDPEIVACTIKTAANGKYEMDQIYKNLDNLPI
jgi:glyoxylase-like metal-dependent hydrolase (beta-lactamase superfamily II)